MPLRILLVHPGKREDVELASLPEIFWQWNEGNGYDYCSVFADEGPEQTAGSSYLSYGLDCDRGCIVLCRPDQHVAAIADLEEVELVHDFLVGVMGGRSS